MLELPTLLDLPPTSIAMKVPRTIFPQEVKRLEHNDVRRFEPLLAIDVFRAFASSGFHVEFGRLDGGEVGGVG